VRSPCRSRTVCLTSSQEDASSPAVRSDSRGARAHHGRRRDSE
jgi:hypothetical protein